MLNARTASVQSMFTNIMHVDKTKMCKQTHFVNHERLWKYNSSLNTCALQGACRLECQHIFSPTSKILFQINFCRSTTLHALHILQYCKCKHGKCVGHLDSYTRLKMTSLSNAEKCSFMETSASSIGCILQIKAII